MTQLSRRQLLGLIGGGAVAAGGGLTAVASITSDNSADKPRPSNKSAANVPFYGQHQAGIVTPTQDRLHFAAFDLTTDNPADVKELLRSWTLAAAALTQGLDAPGESHPDAPPPDTGEALGLPAARLTLTVGYGPTLFKSADGDDRFGIANRMPTALKDLPAFSGDALDPNKSGGDLCIQACANDPQVAVHAIRTFARLARGVAVVRYSQLG